MKLTNISYENNLLKENRLLAEDTLITIHTLENMQEAIRYISDILNEDLDQTELTEINNILTLIEDTVDDEENIKLLVEKVKRQFRRYGDKFMRQYRCMSGDKAGRMVTSPEKCGIRKDPRRVRIGKRASRVRKGERIRKTKFTKRKTQSKRLTRLNKTLRGE